MEYAAVGPVAGKFGVYAAEKVEKKFGYFKDYKTNVKNLKKEVQNLQDKKKRVQRQIDAAISNLEIIEDDVQNWVGQVDEITSDTDKFLEADQEKANHRCFNGWCINLWARYKFGKEAFKKAREIEKLQEKANFETVSYTTPLPEIESSSSTKNFTAFESRKSLVKGIMEALDDENTSVIGICGMGGVGKTTIVEEVCRQAKAEKKFDKVVMVVVSQTPNVVKIQGKIAHELNLVLETRDESERPQALWARIKAEKKILVVLDDIWDKLDLIEKVGIPFGEDHKGCKILLTSRRKDVYNKMNAQKIFSIEVLDEEEAWILFSGTAGEIVDSTDLNPIAREVARECGGLPIAIVTVGRALMKNQSKDVWIDAARRLKKSVPTKIEGMEAYVYSSLKLSYNYLESEAKSCFLLCSLFPEDTDIPMMALVRYGIGLRLFQDVDTIEDGRHRALALLSTLVSSFMLLEIDGKIKMHDVVRDFAIHVACKEEAKHIVKAGIGLPYWPDNDTTFQNYTRISLMENNICELPDGLEFPKLEILLLQWNSYRSQMQIPNNFFRGMNDLKVLDMSGNIMFAVPPSIQLLTTLQTLCLDYCQLGDDISIIGTLKGLEILSLYRSNIKEVPRHFTQLTHLKLFDLRFCHDLTQISPGVISSLHKLEELYIGTAFTHWAVEGEDNSRNNVSLSELKSLSQLTSLCLSVPNANMIPDDLRFEKLIRFEITIGTIAYGGESFQKTLRLTYDTRLCGPVKVLLKRSEFLLLRDCKGLKNILEDLDRDGFDQSKSLDLHFCHEMKYLLDMIDGAPRVSAPFRNLEELTVCCLANFSEICHGQLPNESFSNLRSVNLSFCPQLRLLFPPSLIRRLVYLQRLELHYCSNLEEIFAMEGKEQIGKSLSTSAYLQSLTDVTFCECDRLRNIFSVTIAKGLVQLKQLYVRRCAMVEAVVEDEKGEETVLSIDKIVFPHLYEIHLEKLDSLTCFFTGCYAVEFPLLEELLIYYCPKMETFGHGVQMTPNLQKVYSEYDDERIWMGDLNATVQHIFNRKSLQNMVPNRPISTSYLFELLYTWHLSGFHCSILYIFLGVWWDIALGIISMIFAAT
ncbi:hypothetical protein CsSME_00041390 [Camellia sinensis var. sinensis]